ncbi:AraC family transcriptional regulator [Alcanivorax sp. 1008]|uniref:helix-turn-helix transcriptional regulator n=1 Tax=Alcanivorax sp. 1008 TaxID=2816853 RepID=UPI001D450217|nr:AraC family transcriptional regulator [Alcanivorax sp. 1008]MCC1496018.1 helix-turn-helix domain-containing protein [Alcanivorax sp. 1008]
MNLQGGLFLWADGWLLLAGPIHNRPHRHVAASLLFGLDQQLSAEVAGDKVVARALLVAPDVEQSLDSAGATMVVHLDPDSPLWLSLRGLLVNGHAQLDWGDEQAARFRQLADSVSSEPAHELLASLLQVSAADTGPDRPVDPRAMKLASRLRTELPEQLNLTEIAAQLGLSAARLSRLFREAFGITPKRFLLHLKIQGALHCWQPGISAAELAMRAGFYDQPHLIRTAREMFDTLPSALMGNPAFRLIRAEQR